MNQPNQSDSNNYALAKTIKGTLTLHPTAKASKPAEGTSPSPANKPVDKAKAAVSTQEADRKAIEVWVNEGDPN